MTTLAMTTIKEFFSNVFKYLRKSLIVIYIFVCINFVFVINEKLERKKTLKIEKEWCDRVRVRKQQNNSRTILYWEGNKSINLLRMIINHVHRSDFTFIYSGSQKNSRVNFEETLEKKNFDALRSSHF